MKFFTLSLGMALTPLASASKCMGTLPNNIEECFVKTANLASSFCASYLAIPTPTFTVTSSPVAITSLPTAISTDVDTITNETTTTTTSTTTVLEVDTAYVTTTLVVGGPARRNKARDLQQSEAHGKPVPSVLACLTRSDTALYDAKILSAACSCLSVQPATVTTTTTLATSTQTNYFNVTTTTSTTTTQIDITVMPATATSTSIETDVATVTSTYVSPVVSATVDF